MYIDESGVLDKENPTSRFYLISLVAHNEDDDVAGKVEDFKRGLDSIGIANACFHAGPIIYGNDQFRVLNWGLRRRIFSRMMGLVRRVPFVCTCLEVDKHFCDTTEKVNVKIEEQFVSLIDGHRFDLGGPRRFKHDVLRAIKDHWLGS